MIQTDMNMPTPPPPPPLSRGKPGWFSRNWRWFVPAAVLAVVGFFLAIVALIVTLVFGFLRQSEPYTHSLELAKTNAQVKETLGQPVQEGYYVLGDLSTRGDEGEANLSFPIHGPHGKGSVKVNAEKRQGQWIYMRIRFVSEDGKEIDLSPNPDLPRPLHEPPP